MQINNLQQLFTWNPTRIARWNYETFPMITGVEQCKKLEIELREAKKEEGVDKKKWLEEMADVWIVACSLYHRFHYEIGRIVMEYIKSLPEYAEILFEVDRKMEINVNRTWHVTPFGEVRHDD